MGLGKPGVPHPVSGFQTEMFCSFPNGSSKGTFHLKAEGVEEPIKNTSDPKNISEETFFSVTGIYMHGLGSSRDVEAWTGLKKE